jgi:hypothetical protein
MPHKFPPLKNDRLLKAARSMRKAPCSLSLSLILSQERLLTGRQYGLCARVISSHLYRDRGANAWTDRRQLAVISPSITKPKANMTFSNAVALRKLHQPSHFNQSTVMKPSTQPSYSPTSLSSLKLWVWRSGW